MPSDKAQSNLKGLCPELAVIPEGWQIKLEDSKSQRIYFMNEKARLTTYNHPTLGALPRPWTLIVRYIKERGRHEPVYYNGDTREMTTKDPRFDHEYLKSRTEADNKASSSQKIAGSLRRNEPGLQERSQRAEIDSRSIRDTYEAIHTIDAGDGTIGGMNGGVFVVKMIGHPQLYVEKRFKEEIISFARKEIEMLRKVNHGSLTYYCAAFIDDKSSPKDASVYVEFCDRGSLDDIIKQYSKMRLAQPIKLIMVPEKFIWHAFIGLADGLAYLQGGRSFLGDEKKKKYQTIKGWQPILHRDIKPDNVLLRSRATLDSPKYFYCVLSDFGLACDDDDNEPHQSSRYKLGTKLFWAPELCYDPYPKKQDASDTAPADVQFKIFPSPYKHSRKSDVWALGACIYNLANTKLIYIEGRPTTSTFAHVTFDRKPKDLEIDSYYDGLQSRKEDLRVHDKYSATLREAVRCSTQISPTTRPDAIGLVKKVKELRGKSPEARHNALKENDKLPSWATKIHDYHSRVVRRS